MFIYLYITIIYILYNLSSEVLQKPLTKSKKDDYHFHSSQNVTMRRGLSITPPGHCLFHAALSIGCMLDIKPVEQKQRRFAANNHRSQRRFAASVHLLSGVGYPAKVLLGVNASVAKLTHLPWDEAVPLLSFKAFRGLITSFESGNLCQGALKAMGK